MSGKNSFERYFDEQMRDPDVRASYESARERIDAIDRLVVELDEARVRQGLSKAELARMVGADPASVRRLFTARDPNPRTTTLVAVADALGMEVRLAKKSRKRPAILSSH